MNIEEWRPSPIHPDLYEVSSEGNVVRVDPDNGDIVLLLKPLPTPTGYQKVCLWKDNTPSWQYVHRLVLTAFRGCSDLQVNHKDFNKSNNSLDNLEWLSPRENVRHARDNGRFPKQPVRYGMANPSTKYSSEVIDQLREDLLSGNRDVGWLVHKYGISDSQVRRIISGKSRSHD